jgi:DNA-binding XRE family transcriptional regulator
MEINPNSSQSTGSSTAPNALGNVQRPGEYLRQVRINQKRDLAEVAKALNIPEKTLTALEQDEYKALPEATFIKGYYRGYAKFLQVDASNIIQRFDEIYANDTGLLPNHALNNSPIKIMGKLPGSNRERNRKWLKRAGITVAVLLILWAAIAALKGRSDQEEAAPAQDAVEVLSMDGSTVAMSGDQLALNFNRPTSVHIVDSTGKVLLTGRQANATTVSGEPPFQIRLDDAAAVSLNLNNENISLTPYTVGGKAEFRLSR